MAACQTKPAPADAGTAICRAGAAASLVGKDRVGDDDARRLTGAAVVRQIRPGDAYTEDFRPERATIETDPETGKILRAFCG